MPRIYARAVIPRKPFPDRKRAEKILRDAAQQVAEIVVKYFDTIVADWEHRPEFATRIKIDLSKEIVIYVYPTGPNAEIWKYVSGGTRAHVIVPVNAQTLYFKTNYQPRTSGGGRYKGPGKAVGPGVFAKEVHHPGSFARNLEADVARWIGQRKDVSRIITNAMARAKYELKWP